MMLRKEIVSTTKRGRPSLTTMQLLFTSCIFFGICSANVTESALPDVGEISPLVVNETALLDFNETALLDVNETAPHVVNESGLLDVNETAPHAVNETCLLDVNETAPHVVNESGLLDVNETIPHAVNETCLLEVNETTPGPEQVDVVGIFTVVNLFLSVICLFLHLVVFCLVPDLRNLPGCNLAALCACLLVSFIMFLIPEAPAENTDACVAYACTKHFFLLSSFLWMSTMSSTVFVSLLKATRGLRSSGTRFGKRKFGLHCLCVFGVALLFDVSAVLADTLDFIPDHWRPMLRETCWFGQRSPFLLFFAGPVLFLTCLNLVLFTATAYVIHVSKRKCDQDAQKPAPQMRYMMYFRLSAIMGVTWVVAVFSNVFDEEWIWVVFLLLNTLQGFFIFLGFTCSRSVRKYFREKILGARRSSEQSLTPTFQSYCVYSTDQDVTVESSK